MAPIVSILRGPNRSIKYPANGPSRAPSARDSEKIKEVEALLIFKASLIGKKNTENP